jgi:hypothetical protein
MPCSRFCQTSKRFRLSGERFLTGLTITRPTLVHLNLGDGILEHPVLRVARLLPTRKHSFWYGCLFADIAIYYVTRPAADCPVHARRAWILAMSSH